MVFYVENLSFSNTVPSKSQSLKKKKTTATHKISEKLVYGFKNI